MHENKSLFLKHENQLKEFYKSITNELNKTDTILKTKIYRIYRDLRFSKDKTPYNTHRSVSFSRAGKDKRGGYYLRLEPDNSYVAGGFFSPIPPDSNRIRKEFEIDST